MITCKNCNAELNKVSVQSRSFFYLDSKQREEVDAKFFCGNCKKEIEPQELLTADEQKELYAGLIKKVLVGYQQKG